MTFNPDVIEPHAWSRRSSVVLARGVCVHVLFVVVAVRPIVRARSLRRLRDDGDRDSSP